MAYLQKDDAKAIRNELKKRFPKMRFSVVNDNSTAAMVTITKGPKSLESLFSSDYEKDRRHTQLNHYHLNQYGEHETLLTEISEIAHNAPGRAGGTVYFDDSDIMTDYFNTAFYVRLAVGKWDKPFEIM